MTLGTENVQQINAIYKFKFVNFREGVKQL